MRMTAIPQSSRDTDSTRAVTDISQYGFAWFFIVAMLAINLNSAISQEPVHRQREKFLEQLAKIENLRAGFEVDGEVQVAFKDGRTLKSGQFKLHVDDKGQFRFQFSADFDLNVKGDSNSCDAIATYWDHPKTSEATRYIMRLINGNTRGVSMLMMDSFLTLKDPPSLYSTLKRSSYDISDEQFNSNDGFVAFQVGDHSYKLKQREFLDRSNFVVERLLPHSAEVSVIYKFRILVP